MDCDSIGASGMVKKIYTWLDINFEPVIVVTMFSVMTGLVALQVVLRFIFQTGFSWAEEVSRYLFVWIIYLAVSYATRNNRHIKLSVILAAFPDKGKRVMSIVSDFLFFIFSAVAFYACYRVVATTSDFGDKAITINISMNVLYAAGLIGFALNTARLLQNLMWRIRYFKSDLTIFLNENGLVSGSGTTVLGALPALASNESGGKGDS
jgi:TRAP-type transport system small permease protein